MLLNELSGKQSVFVVVVDAPIQIFTESYCESVSHKALLEFIFKSNICINYIRTGYSFHKRFTLETDGKRFVLFLVLLLWHYLFNQYRTDLVIFENYCSRRNTNDVNSSNHLIIQIENIVLAQSQFKL